MKYHILIKTRKQLKEDGYFEDSEGYWGETEETIDTCTHLRDDEPGKAMLNCNYNAKNEYQYTASNIDPDKVDIQIPEWAISRFLDPIEDSMHFI